MNPAAAVRAPADESPIVPPGSDEPIMVGTPLIFQPEVNRLQWMTAAGMGAGGFRINDVWRHLTPPAAPEIPGVH